MKTYQLAPFVLAMLFILVANAQPGGEFDKTAELYSFSCDATTSSFKIQGTSSLHDWEMTSQACKGAMNIFPKDNILDIAEISVQVSVSSLKSGKKIMVKKCYDALKYEDYPNIVFTLDQVQDLKQKDAANYEAVFKGKLHIAGVSKPADIAVQISREEDKVRIKGSKSLKMSDFDVEPPKALMGTLKTGNDIEIIFNLNFIQL